jgi:hypothetical protein
MNEITSQALLWVVYIVIVLAIAGPVVLRLTRNLFKIHRKQQHMRATPGPLLGVVYPKTRKKRK